MSGVIVEVVGDCSGCDGGRVSVASGSVDSLQFFDLVREVYIGGEGLVGGKFVACRWVDEGF